MPESKHGNLYQVEHPLVTHYLTLLRSSECVHNQYRRCIRHLSVFLAYEALRTIELPSTTVRVHTQLGDVVDDQPQIESEKLSLVSVLRGGLIATDAIHELLPRAPIAHFGTSGDKGNIPSIDYERLPKDMEELDCIIVEPRIETGGTSIAILRRLKEIHSTHKQIVFVNIVCAPEGVFRILEEFPEISIVTASLEQGLSEQKEVIPGIGRVGDRLYETALRKRLG